MYDDFGGHSFPVFHKETILQLAEAYKKAMADLKEAKRRRKEEAEAAAKAKSDAEAAAKRIFPIKGSAAPTNPWKKPQ